MTATVRTSVAAGAAAVITGALLVIPGFVVRDGQALAAAVCTAGTPSDFNGDGVEDVAIADPRATVGGKADAGQIHIGYGGTGATSTLDGSTSQVGGAVVAGDQFGYSLSAYDANADGCSDLAVGVPFHDIGTVVDAGAAYVLLGSPAGLAKGAASIVYHQDVVDTPGAPEPGDYFGFSVAGAKPASGASYLVAGVPGEDIGTVADAGMVHYFRGTTNVVLESGTPIPGASEPDDQNGYSVAAAPSHFVIGSPGEAIGDLLFAGSTNVFSSTVLVDGLPKLVTNIHQDYEGVAGASEADDQFGKSVAIAAYRPAGAPATQADSLLVVGVPGEDTTAGPDSGTVQRFQITAAGTFTELPFLGGGLPDGSYFGEKVALMNTAPATVGSDTTMFIAVGSPGEDKGEALDGGAVRVYRAVNAATTAVATIDRRDGSLTGEVRAQELVGVSLGVSAKNLYVGTTYGGDPAVHAFGWTGLAAGTASPTTTFKPGSGTIPAGSTAFGAAIG